MRFALDHLWQSSLFAASAWALTFALRRNHARARYVVWLAASVKFLIPFALLTAIGSAAHDRVPAPMASPPLALLNVVDAATVPFSSAHDVAGTVARTSEASGAGVIEWALFVMWLTGMLTLTTRWTARWVRLARVARRAAASTSGTDSRVLALSSRRALPVAFVETNCEPGVFGIVRPVLLWPVGVSERLSDEQVESIVAHELCHVRWRDNASAALHMIVEALFWFHPLVWWIGARLVDERERGCDEDVLRAGRAAQDYAEGILTICEFQLTSPLACVAGVTGSDLRRRITDIMRRHTGETLHGAKRSLLAAVAVVTIAAPIGVAAWRGQAGPLAIAPVARERTFDAASIKQNKNGTFGPQGRTVMSLLAPGERVRFVNVPLRQLVVSAYPGYTALQGPDWIGAPGPPSDKIPRFDVEARAATSLSLQRGMNLESPKLL